MAWLVGPVPVTALAGTASFEQSVLTWASEHRYHHRYVDQDGFPYDPYSIKQGFFHAHVGWLIWKRQPVLPRTNVKDLEKDPFLRFQDRFIVPLMVVVGLGMPTLVGTAWAALSGRSAPVNGSQQVEWGTASGCPVSASTKRRRTRRTRRAVTTIGLFVTATSCSTMAVLMEEDFERIVSFAAPSSTSSKRLRPSASSACWARP